VADFLPFQAPGARVGDIDRPQAQLQGRVDVGTGRIADHPAAGGVELAPLEQLAVGCDVLLVNNGRVGEVWAQAGAVDLEALLVGVALGEQEQLVAARRDTRGSGATPSISSQGWSRMRSAEAS